jgi:RimJ/RimL family protein N-acetyltransferase
MTFTGIVLLRDVAESDLPVFFEQQNDPLANQLAAFPAREREKFMAHWAKILANEEGLVQTILWDGQVAGNLVCFEMDGEREVGYWLGREFWGQGIATRALASFLELVKFRPLYAHVAKHNHASRRVLEKCGFILCGEDKEFSSTSDGPVEGFILRLE